MRYNRAHRKERSYAQNGEEFWPPGVSHIEQHTKFAQEFAQLEAVSDCESRRLAKTRASLSFCENLPARRHFCCGHRLQVRLLQHGIRVGQLLILKVGPPR